MEALAKERVADWGKKFGEMLGLKVVELTGARACLCGRACACSWAWETSAR